MSPETALGTMIARPTAAPRIARADLARTYDEHGAYVYRALRHLGVADSDLDDAVQDVFLVLVRRAEEFDGRSSVRTWLFGIALHVARRSRQVRDRRATREVEAELEAPSSPFDETATARDAALLARALDALPDAQREVFVLMELEGLTAPEVSALLAVKLNTVYSRLRLARREIECFLAQEREESPGV
jgi:RNA polymerase sigma-70 factor (ECF subfamily)